MITQETVDNIVYLLQNTPKSVSEISKQTGVSDITIYYINTGKHTNSRKELNYPIRNGRYSYDFIKAIINDLQGEEMKIIDNCDKYKISRSTISGINNGRTHKIYGIQYPIRSSKNRVYQSCRDYPELDWE